MEDIAGIMAILTTGLEKWVEEYKGKLPVMKDRLTQLNYQIRSSEMLVLATKYSGIFIFLLISLSLVGLTKVTGGWIYIVGMIALIGMNKHNKEIKKNLYEERNQRDKLKLQIKFKERYNDSNE